MVLRNSGRVGSRRFQREAPVSEDAGAFLFWGYFVCLALYWLSGNIWLVSFKISYLCLPLFYETRTTPSCHPSGCAYRQL